MNKPFIVLGSITVGVCTSLAQNVPTPSRSDFAPPPANAATTRHGRVQGILATPDGNISGLFLGGRTAVALSPELSRQIASESLRGREITVSGPSQTIDGSRTVEAQTLRVGGNTFTASPGPQSDLAAPPLGHTGDRRELAGLRGRPQPGPGAPPPPAPGSPIPPPRPRAIAPPPPPPPPGTNGRNPRATPGAPPPSGPSPIGGALPAATPGERNESAVPPPPQSTTAPGVSSASPVPPPSATGAITTPTAPPPAPPQQ